MNFFQKMIGIFVGKLVLRAQLIPLGELRGLRWVWAKLFPGEIAKYQNLWSDFIDQNEKNKTEDPSCYIHIKREHPPRENGPLLDTIEFCREETKDSNQYVIFAWGRNDCFEENLERLADDALNLNKKIISFNYRNVCSSEVSQIYCEQDLKDDFIFQVKRLLDRGVPIENITCCGHSLGAANVALAVSQLHRENIKAKIKVNDRSFANLIDTAVDLYFGEKRNARPIITRIGSSIFGLAILIPLVVMGTLTLLKAAIVLGVLGLTLALKPTYPYYDKTVGAFLEFAMRYLMKQGHWEMKAGDAYDNEIPKEYKGIHTYIRSHSKQRLVDHEGTPKGKYKGKDKVILHPRSLNANLSDYRSIKQQIQAAKDAENSDEVERLKEYKRKNITIGKLEGGNDNAHSAQPKHLLTKYPLERAKRQVSGQELFYLEVEPEGGHALPEARKYKHFYKR